MIKLAVIKTGMNSEQGKRMMRLAHEIYNEHFANEQMMVDLLLFVAALLSIVEENMTESLGKLQ